MPWVSAENKFRWGLFDACVLWYFDSHKEAKRENKEGSE